MEKGYDPVEEIRSDIRTAIVQLSAANAAAEKAPVHAKALLETADSKIETALSKVTERVAEEREAQD